MVRAVIRVPGYGEEGGAQAAFASPAAFGGGAGRSYSSGSSGKRGLMGKVPSLVFEMEDEEGGAAAHAEQREDADAGDLVAKLQALQEPWSEAEYMVGGARAQAGGRAQLLLHVRFAREEAAKLGCVNTLPDLADTLRRLGYAVKLRTALGGGGGGACLRNLRHSFITCAVQGPSGACVEYVVDPRFREQFEIAHATGRYAAALAALGPELVSTPDRLGKVVELLCCEMARAFAETGTPLPPWRQYAAMLSKWEPRRSEEVAISAAGLGSEPGPLAGRPAGAPPPGPAGRRKVAPVTGPATIAQRLAMLGVAAPTRVSPVAEGTEAPPDAWPSSLSDEEEEEEGGGGPCARGRGGRRALDDDGSASTDSAGGSLLLDTSSGGEEPGYGGGGVGEPHLLKSLSANLPAPTETGAARGKPGSHIWHGIRKAVAALPQRRSQAAARQGARCALAGRRGAASGAAAGSKLMQVTADAYSEGPTTLVSKDAFQFIVDEPRSIGGGPNPLTLLLGGLAGCTAFTARMIAKERGLPELRRVQWSAAGQFDLAGVSSGGRGGGADARIQRVELRGTADTDASAEELRRVAAEVEGRCVVAATLRASGVQLTLDLQKGSVAHDCRPACQLHDLEAAAAGGADVTGTAAQGRAPEGDAPRAAGR
eukprot:scaffold2.g7486.t1